MSNPGTVLLVEDDVVDVKTMRRAFGKAGLTTPLHVEPHGADALAFLRGDKRTEAPDPAVVGLILLDLNMPVMGGLEFLRRIRADEHLRHIPVVALTSSREESDLVASYAFGVAGYMVKPVDFAGVMRIVTTLNAYWSLCERPPGAALRATR